MPASQNRRNREVLVTGGAGYIGSHVVRELSRLGYTVVVLDNLGSGHLEAMTAAGDFQFYQADLQDKEAVDALFQHHRFSGVIHMAGATLVGESVKDPEKYYGANVQGGLNLLSACIREKIRHLVFSSTCATYGIPLMTPITEDHPQIPVNPYGHTKLAFEQILRSYQEAYGISYLALRYFNAAGADPLGELGEDHEPETHLIPCIFRVATGQLDHLTIYGKDYPTPDGTCIRDYVHVSDLARAHVTALEYLLDSGASACLNLGTGYGHSVLEVVKAAEAACGKKIKIEFAGRREGDVPVLVADATRAQQVLKFDCMHSAINMICADAWRWHSRHPLGYKG